MPVLIDDLLDSGPPVASPSSSPPRADDAPKPAREIGGPPGAEPTRFGDWEQRGRCIDF
ncbi:MAG TPA: succinate dehydrogenase assembly factor 4 [Steroidobacteraceae bacterium]